MENTDLKNLQLEEKDFDLLLKGLEVLPSSDLAGEMMIDLFSMAFAKDDPEAKQKLLEDKENRKRAKEKEKQHLIEEVKILQGKLLLLKRYLIQNNLLKDAENILRK